MTSQKPDRARQTCVPARIPLDPLPERPLVSILISSYNYGEYLGDAIESALQQTYDKLEIIICDDGSTDGSPGIIERYRTLDQRIRVIYQGNGGQALALNAAFDMSTGDIICLLDADDVFMADKVRRVVEAFCVAPDAGLAVNRMSIVDKYRKSLGEIPLLSQLAEGWQGPSLNICGPRVLPGMPPCSGLSLRRGIAESLFPLPSGLTAYADTLIQVLAPRITPIVAIQTASSEYRVHGGNVAAVNAFTEDRLRNVEVWEREIWRAWRRHVLSSASADTALSETNATIMGYAYARFRSDPRSKAVYQAIPGDYLRALPSLFRWYWRAATLMPNWLFRKSFNLVYAQSRAKRVVAGILRFLERLAGAQAALRKDAR